MIGFFLERKVVKMISKIKKDLEILLSNFYETDKTIIKKHVDNFLYANYNNVNCKVVCDETNNPPTMNDKYLNIDIYNFTTYTKLNITIVRNKIKELREERIKKLNKLNKISRRKKFSLYL